MSCFWCWSAEEEAILARHSVCTRPEKKAELVGQIRRLLGLGPKAATSLLVLETLYGMLSDSARCYLSDK